MTGRTIPFDAPTAAVTVAGRRMRMHAFVVLALTFVAGGALGWGAAHRLGTLRSAVAGPAGVPGGGGRRPNMQQQLGLTDAQCGKIDSVFASRRTQIDGFWKGPGSQLRSILDSTTQDVRGVLDSAQRTRLDEINARRRHRGDGRGPDGRGPDGRNGSFCKGGGGPPSGGSGGPR